ncbi:50S ribosomal protein L35 [Microgenomates group bacterium RIFCSPLOWO2_01_FULL_46_13]|nr:MAG: 50S ribosomal protein L35 [Microgenomates group bacterium RIFCSPHIGHO2_01_FULL_45_11]OGV94770.1 MAG: 50S ribosomal protein L35 [Microgenomates group bacterium RIFCSPLOWO2_01_FULL_46_13]
MPKVKTRKIVAKRFKITKTGKILRRAQNMRHLRRRKSKRQIRAYRVPKQVTGKMAKKIRTMLGR